MLAGQILNRRLLTIVTLLLTLSLITGCGGGAPAPVPTQPTSPTPKPPPTITVDVSPGLEVPVGKSVSIVISVVPYEQLDWNWSLTGTGGGQLSSKTGENVVYKAGMEGMDNVVAEAKTADGATLKKTVALTIVAAPYTPTPVAPMTATPLPTPTMSPPSGSAVTLTNIQDGQEVPCSNVARGTYPLDLTDEIWPVVYVIGRYYPQDEGGQSAQKNGGNWYQTVRFGDCNNPQQTVGQQFQLIIYTVDASAKAEFEKYLKTGAASGLPGMTKVPEGATEQLRIGVIRK